MIPRMNYDKIDFTSMDFFYLKSLLVYFPETEKLLFIFRQFLL